MNLQGKKALVFGGTSGIGLATIKMLQAQGATVVAISRNPDKAGDLPGVELVACDVRDEEALAALFAAQAPYDVLISAATGGERAAGPFLQMDLAGYRGSFDKLWGYTNVVRLGTEHLSDDGNIVLVSGAPRRVQARSGSDRFCRRCGRAVCACGGGPSSRLSALMLSVPALLIRQCLATTLKHEQKCWLARRRRI